MQRYERTHAVRDLAVVAKPTRHTASGGDVYVAPGAPVHVMAGTGGASADLIWQQEALYPWSAKRMDGKGETATPWGWLQVDANDTALGVRFFNVAGSEPGLFDHLTILRE